MRRSTEKYLRRAFVSAVGSMVACASLGASTPGEAVAATMAMPADIPAPHTNQIIYPEPASISASPTMQRGQIGDKAYQAIIAYCCE